MKCVHLKNSKGFTLIELIVVIAILATLAAVGGTAIYSHMGTGDAAKCRANLEQLALMGTKYGQDITHRTLLPTSGMDDDEDTPNICETDGWWIALAPLLGDGTYVMPTQVGGTMKISTLFHCPSDNRRKVGSGATMAADLKNISYVSWTDATEDPDNVNSCIRTSAKQNLDMLPWISDGIPVKGKSVTDADTFRKMVMPAAERHGGSIMVAYASGVVKAVELQEGVSAEEQFKKIAPPIANKKTTASDEDAEAEEEESDDSEDEE